MLLLPISAIDLGPEFLQGAREGGAKAEGLLPGTGLPYRSPSASLTSRSTASSSAFSRTSLNRITPR